MNAEQLDPRLPLLQNADLNGKIVLVRVDHNVVKKNKIKDAYRIDCTFGTLFNIVARGGKPILMTHVGRPYDKKSGTYTFDGDSDVTPIAAYLSNKLKADFKVVEFPQPSEGQGIAELSAAVIDPLLKDLKSGKVQALYLPNTRWLVGEEAKGETREKLAKSLAGLADLYVNDAFGSWQPHASTYDVTRYLPSYTGFLLQAELLNLNQVLKPQRPFLSVIAGAKYDTKIGPLTALYEQADYLLLGGVVYNTFLAAKYGVEFQGVTPEDVELAKKLVELDRKDGKIIELGQIVESDILGRQEGKYRTVSIKDFKPGQKLGYGLDVGADSFKDQAVQETIAKARTIFVNAVMGFTPDFGEGTQACYAALAKNAEAKKLFGGGDTLEDLKKLQPGIYLRALDDQSYYFFTGGGSVLTALEQKSAYGLEPVKALLENGGK